MNPGISNIQSLPSRPPINHTSSLSEGKFWKALGDAGTWYLRDLRENSFSHLMLTVGTICALWGAAHDESREVLLYISSVTLGEFYIDRFS